MDFYQNEEQNFVRIVSGWVVDLAVALALAWFFVHSFGSQVTVEGQSMTPLLNSGDTVLANRLAYDLGKPERLDVVVFEREEGVKSVKRVVGIPGDVVQIRDGFLYINEEKADFADGLDQVSLAGLAKDPVELGEQEYFLLGDNRDSSEDSRFANVGKVKEEQIMGKVWLRLFPFIDVKLITGE